MNPRIRIVMEILGPPLLGTVVFSVFNGMWSWREFSFVLFFAYLFGIVPSCIYAVMMELWIRGGGARKCGRARYFVADSDQPIRLRLITNDTFSCARLFTIPGLGIEQELPMTGE